MANALGRISGQLLKDNLTRNSHDLAFDTDLIYLNVANRYVGFNTDVPFRPLLINGTSKTNNLIIDNQLSLPNISVFNNEIHSINDLNLNAANYVFSTRSQTDNIDIDGLSIATIDTDQSLSIEPNGSGTLEVFSNLNVTGNLRAWDTGTGGNITLDGNITFGSDDQDSITFASDINSDIVPDQTETYSLGSNPTLGGKRWKELHPTLINGQAITLLGISSGSINQVLRQGNIWYVATNGDDTNVGDHQEGPFATIAKALSEASSGDTIYIYPGTYTEITPLTVPVGVSVRGVGIRSVTVIPDATTVSENVFLLNGETTISDLTVKNFYYNSINDTGYAFSFASGLTVSSRSPYIQNVTVITSGSVTSPSDPRGFSSGDAGKGAKVDGSLANASSKEASLLFHSCTFICPGMDAITMLNGVRVEWLNSFTYYANRGLYALNGTAGFANLGLRFGAEIRSIGSASVYGNYGAEANGSSTLMYLINHNFAYIGAGKDTSNDPSLNIAVNETVELAGGKIYYQSVDNKGNFAVGDPFKVSFEDGSASINGVATNANGISSITFGASGSETVITSNLVSTGNIKFESNVISSLSGPVNFSAATDEILLNNNTNLTNNLNITNNFSVNGTLTVGNQFIDVVTFNAPIQFDFRPVLPTYTLGTSLKKWNQVYVVASQIDDTITISTNNISTITTNTDLEILANGTGKIKTTVNNAVFSQNLDVADTTSLKNTNISGIVDITGNYQQVGDYTQTGNRDVSGLLTVTSDVYFDDINFIQNRILTTIGNNNLDLRAAGTGKVKFNENLRIVNNFASNTLVTNTLSNSGTITSDIFTDSNIEIYDNTIKTTVGNTDLVLEASGTGILYFSLDPLLIDNDLTVVNTSNLKNTTINGTLIHVGNTTQTGDMTNHTGNLDITGNLTVTGTNAYFQNIRIVNNQIFTSTTNSNLILQANGSGIININDYARFGVNLTVSGLTSTNGISSTGTIIANLFDDSNIQISGNLIATTIGNSNLILTGNGTGGPKLEKIKFNSTEISTESNNDSIIFSIPSKNLLVNANTSLKIPAGTTANRSSLIQGDLRFNTTDNLYRGFSTAKVSFNGVYSDNIQTNAVAHPTNNTLNFTNANISTATISTTGLSTIALQVDDINFNNNIISTTATDTDITFSPNGSGYVNIDDINITSNEILNLNLTQPLIIQNTNQGYVKFAGTGGITIPVGDNASRPLNPETGDMRWNTELSTAEVFNGIEYQTLSGDGGDLLNAQEVQDVTNLWALVLG